jgi:biopolymer transport protein ExbD
MEAVFHRGGAVGKSGSCSKSRNKISLIFTQDALPLIRFHCEPHPISMKKINHSAPQEEEPVLDVSSLIDVCFLLLIYFLVTSTIVPRESDLDMSLPSDGRRSDLALLEPLYIEISASGELQVGDKSVRRIVDSDASLRELPLLKQYLDMFVSASKAGNTLPLVRIEADDDVSHQRVIDVLNTLAAVEIHAVTFVDMMPEL